MVKNMTRALAVSTALSALLLIGPMQTSASAQSSGSKSGTTMNSSAPADQNQEHHDYGWVGLLGLAGLAGLRRRSDTSYTPDVRTRDNR